jgi:hypothetical protein
MNFNCWFACLIVAVEGAKPPWLTGWCGQLAFQGGKVLVRCVKSYELRSPIGSLDVP